MTWDEVPGQWIPGIRREQPETAMASVRIVTADEVDSEALDTFLRRFYPARHCDFLLQHGEWWHRGSRNRIVATMDGTVAGYSAVIPAPCRIAGHVHNACWWVNLIVAPEFRGQHLQNLMDRRVRKTYDLLLGFPNALAAGIHRRHGWGVREDLEVRLLPFEPARLQIVQRARGLLGLALRLSARFMQPLGSILRAKARRYRPIAARRLREPTPTALAAAFERHHPGDLITTSRDAEYLRWRYFDSPHRDSLSFFAVGQAEAPRLVAIARHRDTSNGRVIMLLDLFGDLEDQTATADLIRLVARHAALENASEVTAFVSLPALYPVFRSAGFYLRKVGRSCWLSSDPDVMRCFATQQDHWCLGDSDFEALA